MDFLLTPVYTVAAFILVFGVLVFVHEMGHFWVARRAGVRVEVFSIGFGPEIFGWNDRHGTRWKVSWVPLGGYVKFFGDESVFSSPDDDSGLSEAEKAVSFHHKPLRARTAIVAAGPLANLLFAVVVFAVFFTIYGQPFTPPVAERIVEGSAAAEAGLRPGDRIIAIDDEATFRFSDIQSVVFYSAGKPLNLTIQRDDEQFRTTVTPKPAMITDNFGNQREIGRLGIERPGGREVIHRNPAEAVWYACLETGRLVGVIMDFVGKLVVGERPAEDLGGPLMIAELSRQTAEAGIIDLITFMALLSINLGLINLFPVPLLDGGHLMFYAFEAVRGKPLGPRAQEYGFRIGMAAVLMLTVFVTWNDLERFRVFDFFARIFA